MINITFPDGNVRQYEAGTSALYIAKSISMGLANKVLAAKVDGNTYDLTRPIATDASLQLLTWDDADAKKTFWHSSAHILAEAIQDLYPQAKFRIGAAIEMGFYYDIDFGDKVLQDADFKAIEDKFLEKARSKNTFLRTGVSKADAIDYFTKKGDEYKLELIEGLEDGSITFYQQGLTNWG